MKLRFLAVVAVVAAFTCTITAHAQVGLYLNPVATRISNSVGDTGPYAFLGQNSKSQMFYGVDFGGYYDFFHGTKLNAGFDMRDSIVHGNNAMLNSFLVGVRVSGKPFDRPFKPYLQGSVGAGSSRAPTGGAKTTRAQYGLFAGVDYPIAKHVDFRILEVGYSSLTTVSSETIGGTSTIPASNLLNFSTGLVFRF
jgi:hypothetical protein